MARYQKGYLREQSGAWHAVYYTPEGKQKSHRLCDNEQKKSVVNRLFGDFMREVNEQAGHSGPMGVVEFWEKDYLPFIKSNNNLKPSTVHGYQQVFAQHLRSHFNTIQLQDYKTPMMTNFLTGLAKTLRPRTLNTIKWLASAIFAHAVATGKCVTNPIRDAAVLGKTLGHGDTKSYTLEEAENLISALIDRGDAQLVMSLSLFLGIRKGEIQALQWSDVDGDYSYIHIRRAFSRGIVGEPKSKKSVRALPLIQPVKGLLMLWRAKCKAEQVWVFQNSEGGALNMDQFAREVIRPALRKAGVPWKGYHAGRRGLGTELRALTGDSTAGRDVLGHATTQITEAHYEHRLPETALRALKLLEAKVLSK